MLGMGVVAKSEPDGYTLAAGQGGNLCVLPHTSKNVPYDALKDFAAIALTTTNYLVIYANTGAPFKTLPEMIAYAKANPGKMTVATNGEGGFPHLAFEHLRLLAGFTYNHIPYKGSAQIGTDVMGGQVQMAIDGVAGALPAIRSGKVNLLAVTSKKRAAFWPDKPAAAEFVPGYDSGGWFGFVAPAGIPREIANKLNAEINRAMNSPEVVEKMVNGGNGRHQRVGAVFRGSHQARLRQVRQARPRHRLQTAIGRIRESDLLPAGRMERGPGLQPRGGLRGRPEVHRGTVPHPDRGLPRDA